MHTPPNIGKKTEKYIYVHIDVNVARLYCQARANQVTEAS